MSDRKRIPEIKLPQYPDDNHTHLILGNDILFIGIERDGSPSNPLEDTDGMGRIEQIDSRHWTGVQREQAKLRIWDDYECVIPLRYREGYECEWGVHPDAKEISSSARVARNTAILLNRDEAVSCDEFEPDWLDRIHGLWYPDKCTLESYTGQDGLTKHEWMIQQAKLACESYTDYCNGNVYGYDVRVYKIRKDDDGEVITELDYYDHHNPLSEDSCWGFYGWDYFLGEVRDVIKGILKDLKYSRRAIAAAFRERVAA